MQRLSFITDCCEWAERKYYFYFQTKRNNRCEFEQLPLRASLPGPVLHKKNILGERYRRFNRSQKSIFRRNLSHLLCYDIHVYLAHFDLLFISLLIFYAVDFICLECASTCSCATFEGIVREVKNGEAPRLVRNVATWFWLLTFQITSRFVVLSIFLHTYNFFVVFLVFKFQLIEIEEEGKLNSRRTDGSEWRVRETLEKVIWIEYFILSAAV